MNRDLIGVFDSGKGGLTVLAELQNTLPNESFLYYGDIANLPFGSKSKEELLEINRTIISYMINKGAKLIVLACNTSSAIALPIMKKEFPKIPIIGIIGPAINEAISITKNEKIGVFATEATINSHIYQKTIKAHNPGITVTEIGCPEFVPIVENNLIQSSKTKEIVKKCLDNMLKENIDTLIHGCTHYPFLEGVMKEYSPTINYINPACGLASLTKSVLNDLKIAKSDKIITSDVKYIISEYKGGAYVRTDGREYFLSSTPANQK